MFRHHLAFIQFDHLVLHQPRCQLVRGDDGKRPCDGEAGAMREICVGSWDLKVWLGHGVMAEVVC